MTKVLLAMLGACVCLLYTLNFAHDIILEFCGMAGVLMFCCWGILELDN